MLPIPEQRVIKPLEDLVEGDWAIIDSFMTPSGLKIYIDYGLEGNGSNKSIYYKVVKRERDELWLEPNIVKGDY